MTTVGDVIRVCPYCGDEYGGRLGCCGESIAHATYIVIGIEDEQFDTEAEAWAASDQLLDPLSD